MRLPSYDYSQAGAYFVTICTKDRIRFFGLVIKTDAPAAINSKSTQNIELSYYGKVAEKYMSGVKGLEKYIIMPDHEHMLILFSSELVHSKEGEATAPEINLKSIIRSYKTLVTKECNREIWQRGYHEHIIRNQQDFNDCWEYIEHNPESWLIKHAYKD